ncbi:hypothetical protein OGAPHI_003315 [Ogataea philodendri]|uniref:Uncharacterized protein n=1 Tax=Ogataea philodendri TaxID=1378263 RepID=A0A9P8P853_9ASCO|nr:uncharacterized protein OGAPHI_003315 [Ogataea philodendri]KAH3666866.1 hypothetical protein OGAPHI_003315 [Ogataea philodendri]
MDVRGEVVEDHSHNGDGHHSAQWEGDVEDLVEFLGSLVRAKQKGVLGVDGGHKVVESKHLDGGEDADEKEPESLELVRCWESVENTKDGVGQGFIHLDNFIFNVGRLVRLTNGGSSFCACRAAQQSGGLGWLVQDVFLLGGGSKSLLFFCRVWNKVCWRSEGRELHVCDFVHQKHRRGGVESSGKQSQDKAGFFWESVGQLETGNKRERTTQSHGRVAHEVWVEPGDVLGVDEHKRGKEQEESSNKAAHLRTIRVQRSTNDQRTHVGQHGTHGEHQVELQILLGAIGNKALDADILRTEVADAIVDSLVHESRFINRLQKNAQIVEKIAQGEKFDWYGILWLTWASTGRGVQPGSSREAAVREKLITAVA